MARALGRSRHAGACPGDAPTTRAVDLEVLTSPTPVIVNQGGVSTLALTECAAVVRETLDPSELLRVRVRSLITAPAGAFGDEPVPARMTFSPSYPLATYELLTRIDPELMLPGVGQIPNDTCALAKVNAPFVEAFLLGANRELGREFIWREVPVDPADTWLRTFWDSAGGDVENIARIADWTSGPLGTHPATKDFDPDQVLVLIVKGDLFRRYPRTLVYAVPALWSNDERGGGWERVENEDVEPEQPIFVGSLGKDVVFLGFQFDANVNVDVDVAGSTRSNGPHPGWFFVFEQPPIEPRFGLDLGRPAQAEKKPHFWKNVSWYHAIGAGGDAATHAPLAPLDDGVERQYDERGENTWTETWAETPPPWLASRSSVRCACWCTPIKCSARRKRTDMPRRHRPSDRPRRPRPDGPPRARDRQTAGRRTSRIRSAPNSASAHLWRGPHRSILIAERRPPARAASGPSGNAVRWLRSESARSIPIRSTSMNIADVSPRPNRRRRARSGGAVSRQRPTKSGVRRPRG